MGKKFQTVLGKLGRNKFIMNRRILKLAIMRKLFLWDTKAFYFTDEMETEFHEHHAVSIAIALEEPFLIETKKSTKYYKAAIVKPNLFHRTSAPNIPMMTLILDPNSYEYGYIQTIMKANDVFELDYEKFLPLREEMKSAYLQACNCVNARNLFESILQKIFDFPVLKKTQDYRIKKIIQKLKQELPESIKIEDLSKEVSLSGDRLIKLFKQEMGLPLRRYLLWLKLLEVARQLKAGANLTDAAHASGFSDSSHLSRIFKENFGFTPSFFFGENSKIDLFFCE